VRAVSFKDRRSAGLIGTEAAKSLQALLVGIGRQNPMIVSTMRTSISLLKAGSGARSARPDSAARRPAAMIVQKGVYRAIRSNGWSSARRSCRSQRPLDETVQMGPAINSRQLETDLDYVESERTKARS